MVDECTVVLLIETSSEFISHSNRGEQNYLACMHRVVILKPFGDASVSVTNVLPVVSTMICRGAWWKVPIRNAGMLVVVYIVTDPTVVTSVFIVEIWMTIIADIAQVGPV